MTSPTHFIARAALLAALAPAAQANLLVNGSFEDATNFTVTYTSGFNDAADDLVHGSSALTGWTVVGGDVQSGDVSWLYKTNPYGHVGPDGDYILDLTAYERNDLGGVSQTFATVDGQRYDVSFLLGTGGSGPSLSQFQTIGPVSVLAQVFSGSGGFITEGSFSSASGSFATAVWTLQTFSFFASGSSATLSIQGLSRGPGNSVFIGLDAVSVTGPVPEPGSAGLLLAGLAALGGVVRRRHIGRVE